MKLLVCAVGRLKLSPFEEIFDLYRQRLFWTVRVEEVDIKNTTLTKEERQRRETDGLFAKIPPQTEIIALDERGLNLSSDAFASFLKAAQDQSKNMAFVIGGADGFSPEGRQKADKILSFGMATWPHLLVRVMLFEQLYRAQQILSGHPYHRR